MPGPPCCCCLQGIRFLRTLSDRLERFPTPLLYHRSWVPDYSRSRLVFVTLEENKIMEKVSLKKLSLIRNCVHGHVRFDYTLDFSGKFTAEIDKAVCGEGTWRWEYSILYRFLKSMWLGVCTEEHHQHFVRIRKPLSKRTLLFSHSLSKSKILKTNEF